MDFGFTLKPENDLQRTVDLTKRAEANGFGHGWVFDSHVLWREAYVLLTLMAEASERLVLGKPPTTMKTLEEAIGVIRDLVEGRAVTFEGTELVFPWTGKWKLPVWVAGYGPMALSMTGRIADGLILQLADPDLIRWFVLQLREAEAAAGRPAGSVKVQAAAPAHVGPRDLGRERTRWFPALVSNHVV